MQNNRDKKRKGPAEERKPDITVNTGNLDEIIARQREREKESVSGPDIRYYGDLCQQE